MSEGHEFLLEVPIDASQVSDFKPDRAVKVVAYNKQGEAQERSVKLNAEGKGTVTFGFHKAPGSLQVALGPETASASDLQHLQTISVNVPASSWRNAKQVKVPAVAISSYYWWWWWRWCQNFKITGRVLCANGSPVVGATVCAIDVDYWWWWTSQEQVGCVTTDATGSFEIDFTRCCGWWPWWWWLTREWLVDPFLVDQITALVKQNPKLGRLPAASPTPSLDVFQPLLASAAKTTRASLSTNLARANQAIVGTAVDPAALDSLRDRLVEVLPKEFPYPIWPWFPWFPWWDCGANIIFKVTQVCGGQTNTIVNETVSDVRWGIPTTLNLTLTANDQACCAYGCNDPEQCPAGNCIVPSDICDINVGSIGGNVGAPPCTPAQVGLLSPGVQDRPFAGAADIFGIFGDAVSVDYYEFQYATSQAGPYSPLPLAAVGSFNRQVLVVLPGPIFSWVPVGFPVNTISDGVTNHNVIETIAHYEANNGPQTWDAITHDLLVVLNSLNTLANGTYYLRLVSYVRPGYAGNLALANTDNPGNPGILPVCDPNPDPLVNNWWAITIDNQAPGNTDPSGQPCGLHLCTDQPTAAILQVAIVNSGGTTVINGCDNVCIKPDDLLQIDFVAYDPDGFLASYNLELLYGLDQSVNLLCGPCPSVCTPSPCFSAWSLGPSPIAPVWAPGAAQVGPSYSNALGEGATSPVWSGGSMRLTVNASSAFPETCAYLLQLNVYKRPIVNCDAVNDEQYNVSFESFTIQVNCPTPS